MEDLCAMHNVHYKQHQVLRITQQDEMPAPRLWPLHTFGLKLSWL